MVLNWIWISFFLIAFLMAAGRSLFGGDLQVWSDIMNASFDQAAFAFEISLGLTGVLTLWLGIMKIGEKAGVVEFFGRLISPFFSRLFPGIPKGHPAMGAIFMNISANMLGLDNAATPMGLKAMQEMQSLNPKKDTATDAMIMFLVLNSSGLCLIPISIMMYRAQGGAANPTDVFIPILIATAIATIVGLTALCIRQKIKMDRVIWGWLGAIAATVGAITYFFANLPADIKNEVSRRFGFTVNIGISNNKLLAKMASDFEKPDKVHTLFPEEIQVKMWPLPVAELYMAGHSSVEILRKLGIFTIGELAVMDPRLLEPHLKSHGRRLWEFANGIGNAAVEPEPGEAKGIGNSTTLSKDAVTEDEAKEVLKRLAASVGRRLRSAGQKAKMLRVEIK